MARSVRSPVMLKLAGGFSILQIEIGGNYDLF